MAARTVNDFTIRVATVNGSGSQSSNLVLTNAIFKLGIPVAPKNVFPSNIEGLPTWFDVRVTAQGYRCRTRDVDVLVALNAASWEQDVAGVKPGGAVVHESTYPLTNQTLRTDLTYYAVPFAALAKEHFADKGDLRKYLTNMIYVGVLAVLLDIPLETVEEGLRAQFRTKAAAVELNMNAVRVGFDYARANLEKRDAYVLERLSGKTDGYLFMEGNRAAALGCVMGGCTVAAWYPITPSSSLCEYFIQYCDRYRTDAEGERKAAIVQAEDELAAAGIMFGAGWAGARAMTSTSGPGISLMAEYAGYGYFAEVPGVIFDVQRAGPSTGLPTRTMQGDVAFAYTLSHGDTKHIVLLPATVREAYEFAMEAFDLADRFQTPVFVLSDLDLGMNSWLTKPLPYPKKPYDRGKVLSADDLSSMKTWGRYRDVDKDGIGYRTLPGTKHPNAGFFTRGTGHDEEARYSEQPDVWQRNLDRLLRKLETARTSAPAPLVDEKGNKVAILAYGTTHHAVVEARDRLHDAGIDVDYMRVRALPLSPEVATFVKRHERVYVVEQNRDGQLHGILRTELPTHLIGRLESICHYNGVPIDARVIFDPLLEAERQPAVAAE
jgi:2-oxoglutarate/2-oxoacid ferredoxin oxidoreductase subunit alpha